MGCATSAKERNGDDSDSGPHKCISACIDPSKIGHSMESNDQTGIIYPTANLFKWHPTRDASEARHAHEDIITTHGSLWHQVASMLRKQQVAQQANAVNYSLLFVLDQSAQKSHVSRSKTLPTIAMCAFTVEKMNARQSSGQKCMRTNALVFRHTEQSKAAHQQRPEVQTKKNG